MPAAPVVLDSYALVAYLRDEPDAAQVEALLTKAVASDHLLHMTEVNYAEVKYTVLRKDGTEAWAASARILSGLPIEFHPVTRQLAEQAADYKARYRISLADAFAAALAKEKRPNSSPAIQNSNAWKRKSKLGG